MPYQLCYMLIVSPAQWQKVKDWRKFAEQPSGTGPFKVTKFVPRERLELEANKAYWDAKRRPKIDKLVLLPMPEPTTRLAALRSGQVDWIEVPPPDAIPQLKGGGFTITLNSYPHNWTHTLAAGQGAVEQQARPQGRELCHRPGRHLQEPPERHLHSGHRRRVQGATRGSASPRRPTTTTRPRPRSCCVRPGSTRASIRRRRCT